MNTKHMLNQKLLLSVAILIWLGFIQMNPLQADTLEQIVKTNLEKTREGATSQRKIDKIQTDTTEILEAYRNSLRQADALTVYNRQLQKQLGDQQVILTELDESIQQVLIIERQLPQLMREMLDTLAQFVELDAPFHRAERQQRIEQLSASMTRPDISIAEKFRQLLEAYKIENEYGRKIDSYEDTIEIEGEVRKVNILRVGRIALLYQTRDRKQAGVWDRDSGQWLALDSGQYRNAIVRGLRIAKNQAAIEMLQLPIPTLEVAK